MHKEEEAADIIRDIINESRDVKAFTIAIDENFRFWDIQDVIGGILITLYKIEKGIDR